MIWVALILFLAAAALLAGMESALIGVSRVRARHAADDGDTRAARLARLLEQRQELLRAAMTAHHFCSVTAFAIIAVLLRRVMGSWGILVAAVLAAPFFLILLELAPKALFRRFPFRLLRRLTFVLDLLRATALPWRILARRQAASSAGAPPGGQRADVSSLAENINSLKLLPENASTLLARYAFFSSLRAQDAAAPLQAVSAMPAGMPLDAAMQLAMQSARRYHPVLDEKGMIIGYLDASGLPPGQPRDRFVRQFTQPLPRIAPGESALHCLQIMRKSAAPFAAVTDGAGRIEGVLELDSLLTLLFNGPQGK